MKHDLKITFLLVGLFLLAQLVGLYVVKSYLVEALPYGIERPPLEETTSFIPIFLTIIFVTIIALLLIRFRARKLWLIWFFLSVFITMSVSFSAFLQQYIALAIAFILTIIKVFKRNLIIHNFTELFIYGGLAAVFVPLLSLWSIIILLILISIYDVYAVWKSKHMVKLAKYQAKELHVFAGLYIVYAKKKEAILGGGDIGFPLLFSGVILKDFGFLNAVVVSLFVTLALLGLLFYSEKKKYYPAMPFLTAGCLIGYLVMLLLL